jgi:alpha-glucosidase
MQIPHPANFRFDAALPSQCVFQLQGILGQIEQSKSLRLSDSDSNAWLEGDEDGWFGKSGEAWLVRLKYQAGMRFFGLGQKTGMLEKTGVRTQFWNVDVWGYHPLSQIRIGEVDPQYISVPWLIIEREIDGVRKAIGLYVDHPGKVFMSLAPDMRLHHCQDAVAGGSFYLGAPDGVPSIQVFLGETVEDVAEQFSRFVGTMACPPVWAFGNHQCRWGYRGEADLLELDRGFREHAIPCDGLWLDIDYMDGFRVFTTSKEHLPTPQVTLQALRRKGRKVVAILDPGVKDEPGYSIREEGLANDLFCHNPNGDAYRGFVWPGATLFPDFSLPETKAWWAEKVAQFCELGFAGFWLDMNDPSTGSVEQDSMLFGRGKCEHASYHNLYANGMAEATWIGLRKACSQETPFLITRSASAGISRWSGVWMGDNYSNWFHLQQSIPMALNLSLSGIPFMGADVPGFGDDANAELMQRWVQAHCLFPFFRNHSVKDSIRQEPWVFGEPTTAIVRKYVQLRYRFIPYLKSLFEEHSRTGALVLRPYFLEDSADDSHSVEDQYFLGRNVFVAPILAENQKERTVRFPKGEWVDFWTREPVNGPCVKVVKAGADHLPLYYRKFSNIPILRAAPETSTDDIKWDDVEFLN